MCIVDSVVIWFGVGWNVFGGVVGGVIGLWWSSFVIVIYSKKILRVIFVMVRS